jgi:hypothetical protein
MSQSGDNKTMGRIVALPSVQADSGGHRKAMQHSSELIRAVSLMTKRRLEDQPAH